MNTGSEKSSIRISIILILLAFMLIYKLFLDKNEQAISSIMYNSSSGENAKEDKNIYIDDIKTKSYKISGTNIVTDELQSLSVLKLPYKYITKGPNSIYVVYLNNFDQKQKNRIMYENSGNYKIISTDKQKIIDQVEGDEVIYINNELRKGKLVVFIVTKGSDTWLIQIARDDYYKYKKYIYYNLTK